MKPREIEEAMKRFVRGDLNVLVCTSIIGSGLDIPTAEKLGWGIIIGSVVLTILTAIIV